MSPSLVFGGPAGPAVLHVRTVNRGWFVTDSSADSSLWAVGALAQKPCRDVFVE